MGVENKEKEGGEEGRRKKWEMVSGSKWKGEWEGGGGCFMGVVD